MKLPLNIVCAVHMTDSRGNKAGEQSHKKKSIENVKWNENPSISGAIWLAHFKRRSIPTSVSNSDWRFIRQRNGHLMLFHNNESDVIDPFDYSKIRRYFENKSMAENTAFHIACLYFGDGKLASGAFQECRSGFAAFHDYSVG